MAKEIIFASHNPGKIRELQTWVNTYDITIIPQTVMQVSEVEETGHTFVENAIIKARHACNATGLPAIADDSGLAIDILDGAPGIYSARYAGPQATSRLNIEKVLQQLESVPYEQRTARFHCTLVYLAQANDPTPLICQGEWKGLILETPRGYDGFGYDPIFFVPSENKTAAELTTETKNRLSHRGQALRLLMEKLGAVYHSLSNK